MSAAVDWISLGPKLAPMMREAAIDFRRRAVALRAHAERTNGYPLGTSAWREAAFFDGRADALEAFAAELENGRIMERINERKRSRY